jgi:hypothetical protein
MSINIPSHYVHQFATNVQLKLQQKGSKLRDKVTFGTYVGEQGSPVDQIGSIEANEVTTRFGAMPRIDAPVDRRWVYPSSFDVPQLVDSIDKLKVVTDPESALVMNAVLAMGRKIDRVILSAVTGTAMTGKLGTTSTSFTAANEIDVAVGGSNSRINVAKLLALKELMMSQHVDFDEDEVFVGITAKDHGALLNEIQIVSSDYNGGDRPVMKDGKVMGFLGFQFVHCELIETVMAGTNEVTLPAWATSGMHLGMWNDIYGTFGATRTEENKVYTIESYRS